MHALSLYLHQDVTVASELFKLNQPKHVIFRPLGHGNQASRGKLRNHGSVFFNSNTTSSGQLSFLNNMVGVFADEIDAAGNSMTRVWELR